MDAVCSTLCTGFARFAVRGDSANFAGLPTRGPSGPPIAQGALTSSTPCSASECALGWPARRPGEVSGREATDLGSTGNPSGRIWDPFGGSMPGG
jgi:hypothetical protein